MWHGSISDISDPALLSSHEKWMDKQEPFKLLASTLTTGHSFHKDYSQGTCSWWLMVFHGANYISVLLWMLIPPDSPILWRFLSYTHFFPSFFLLWNIPWHDSDIFFALHSIQDANCSLNSLLEHDALNRMKDLFPQLKEVARIS